MSHYLVILVNGVDETQRAQVQAYVKERALEWWHQWPDVWFVETSERAKVWRDALTPVFHKGAVIIVTLPEPRKWDWAARAASSHMQWFKDMSAPDRGAALPRPAADDVPF